jgi:hypothetical protein
MYEAMKRGEIAVIGFGKKKAVLTAPLRLKLGIKVIEHGAFAACQQPLAEEEMRKGTLMTQDSIGCNEFASIIGADHSDVSREASRGLLTVLARRASGGPGSTMLSLKQARRLAVAVKCGLPWRLAAELGDRLKVVEDASAIIIISNK